MKGLGRLALKLLDIYFECCDMYTDTIFNLGHASGLVGGLVYLAFLLCWGPSPPSSLLGMCLLNLTVCLLVVAGIVAALVVAGAFGRWDG